MSELRHLIGGTWKRYGRDLPVNPPSSNSPVIDAGSLPIGFANYAAPGGAVFMATDGNDTTGSGTQAAPYKSLSKALSAVTTNGTIVIRGGIYNDGLDTQSGTPNSGLIISKTCTIQNYPNEAVWFDGSRQATSWTVDGATWKTSYNRLFDRSPTDARGAADSDTRVGWQWVRADFPTAPWPDMVLLDGTRLTPVTTKAAVGPGKFFVEGASTGNGFWFQATALYIGNDPTGREVMVSDKTRFAAITANGVTIRGIGIRRYSNSTPDSSILQCGRPGTVLENVRVDDAASCAISFEGGTTQDASGQTATKVSVYRAGLIGLKIYMADDLMLDRVDVQYANLAHFNYAPSTGSIRPVKSQRLTLKNSIIANNYSKGFWTDMTVGTAYVLNSLFQNNEDDAITLECSARITVANCKIIGSDHYGLFVDGSDVVKVWNCTFTDCGGNRTGKSRIVSWNQGDRRVSRGNATYNQDPRQSAAYYANPENDWQINKVTLCNSVLHKPRAQAQAMLGVDDLERSAGLARPRSAYSLTMDGNLYYWPTPPQFPWVFPSVAGGSTGPDVYFNVAAVRTNVGTELVSTSTTVDPLDVDLNVKDAALHNNAQALPADVAALIGQPTGTKHVGCFW